MPIVTCAAVLFDLDGVLADSTAAVEQHWYRFADHAGLPADVVLQAAHGRRSADVIAGLVPPGDATEAAQWFEQLEIADVAGIEPLPGAAELLADLPPSRWAIVTSCGLELALARLLAAGLPPPRHLITADDVAEGKPDPEGYRRGAAALGVEAEAAVVFEDAPSGADAARRAGATVVALTTTHGADEVAADHHIADLRDVTVVGAVAGSSLELRLAPRAG